MPKIIVTCEDFNPSVIPIWVSTWDKLKQKHPSLKVTAFTVPLYQKRMENDVFHNKDFQAWFKERKEWVEIAQEGYGQRNKLECKRFKKPQYFILRKGYRKIGVYMPKNYYSFKCPDDKMGSSTLDSLKMLGFSSCMFQGQIIILINLEKQLEDHIIIGSHINLDERNPDDIQQIQHKLDDYFTKLELEGNDYMTISELISLSKEEIII